MNETAKNIDSNIEKMTSALTSMGQIRILDIPAGNKGSESSCMLTAMLDERNSVMSEEIIIIQGSPSRNAPPQSFLLRLSKNLMKRPKKICITPRSSANLKKFMAPSLDLIGSPRIANFEKKPSAPRWEGRSPNHPL